jgi:DHA2 family multidrug resistance protein
MGMTFMPINVVSFSTLGMAQRTDGSSLLYLLRSLGGSLGISLTTTALTRGIQVSHQEVGSHVTASSSAVIDPSTADRWGPIGDAALRVVDLEVTRQAAMIAYLNDFKLMMIVVLCFMPLILFMRPGRMGAPQAVPEH